MSEAEVVLASELTLIECDRAFVKAVATEMGVAVRTQNLKDVIADIKD